MSDNPLTLESVAQTCPLSEDEQRIYESFTWDHTNGVHLRVGCQSFEIRYDAYDAFEAERDWMRRMLARALDNLVTMELEARGYEIIGDEEG